MFKVFTVIFILCFSSFAEGNKEVRVDSINQVSKGVDHLLTAHLGLKRFDWTVSLKEGKEKFYYSLVSYKHNGHGVYEKEVLFSSRMRTSDGSLIKEFNLAFMLDEENLTSFYRLSKDTKGAVSGTSRKKYKIPGKSLDDYSGSYPEGAYINGLHVLLAESQVEKHYSFIALVFTESEFRSGEPNLSQLDFSF